MKIKIDAILPAEYNPRKISEEAMAGLKHSIERFGIVQPLIINKKTGNLVGGHQRLKAMKELGYTETDVVEVSIDADEEMALNVALNNSAIQGEFTEDLGALLAKIKENVPEDYDKLLLKELESLFPAKAEDGLTDPDAVPEVGPEPVSKMGQIYKLGNHRLMCGDSTKTEDVERLMAGELASLWSSDPPYGISYVSNQKSKGFDSGYDEIANDEKQDEELREFIFKVIETSKPFLVKGFAFYMWHAMKMQAYFSQAAAAAAAGILFHRQIIWNKPQFVFGRGHYHWKHELCLMGWLKGNEPPFYGTRNQSTVWNIDKENDKIHPTQKPIEIFEIPMMNHTKANEICYEPFAGSGSQFIAAQKLGRRCFGMELDPHYVDVIVKRWEDYTGLKAEICE